jgi:hypothetical protein
MTVSHFYSKQIKKKKEREEKEERKKKEKYLSFQQGNMRFKFLNML